MEKEEILWYQKARVEWLKNGDRNTSFFHLSTVIKQWRNKVVAIRDANDSWIFDKELVKAHFVNFFTKLFTEESYPHHSVIPNDIFQELPVRE